VTIPRAAVRQLAWKEGRALLPVWLACVVATAFAAVPLKPFSGHWEFGFVVWLRDLTALGFAVGGVTLGALSIGHEFSSESVGVMLSLPMPRRLTLAVKFATLAVALLGLGVVGHLAAVQPILEPFLSHRVGSEGLLVPLLCGLALAPVMTLLSGSTVGGAVVAAVVPVALLLTAETIGQMLYGYTSGSTFMMEELGRTVLWRGLLVAWAVGAIWTVRAFDRLEWTGSGPVGASRWAGNRWSWSRAPADAEARLAGSGWRHRPMVRLVVKDLRLQSVTLSVVAVYVATWVFVFAVHKRWPLLGPDADVMSGLYVAFLSPLAGAMAFAPERSLKTRAFSAALPFSAWQQWALKVGLAAAITLGLGVGLAALFSGWGPPYPMFRGDSLRGFAVFATLATVLSLHTSSFSSSGPRALLVAIPSAIAALVGSNLVGGAVSRWAVAELLAHVSRQPEMRLEVAYRISNWMTREAVGQNLSLMALVVAASVVPLGFSYVNFTSDKRDAWHAWRQVAWIAATMALLTFVETMGFALVRFL
jgi:ABC-type transport system involved in multi-copper enzyme maturation permease subunit